MDQMTGTLLTDRERGRCGETVTGAKTVSCLVTGLLSCGDPLPLGLACEGVVVVLVALVAVDVVSLASGCRRWSGGA